MDTPYGEPVLGVVLSNFFLSPAYKQDMQCQIAGLQHFIEQFENGHAVSGGLIRVGRDARASRRIMLRRCQKHEPSHVS